MGDWQDNTKDSLPARWPGVMIIAMLMALPALLPEQLGWVQIFIPAPLCYYLASLGESRARSLILLATLLAGVVATAVGSLPAFVFACTMLPVGVMLGRAHLHNEAPPQTGLKTVFLLIVLWAGFWLAYGALTQTNPYREMLGSMDKSLAETSTFYQSDAKLALDTKEEVAATIRMLQEVLPKVVPALLVVTIIATVWLNMLASHWLLCKYRPGQSPWPPFREWRLPEHLIWAVIGGGIAVMLPLADVSVTGLNILLICGALYFFQGLAVLAKLFAKWSIPGPLRAFLYAIALVQGAGFIALAVLGIADIWADFGVPRAKDDIP